MIHLGSMTLKKKELTLKYLILSQIISNRNYKLMAYQLFFNVLWFLNLKGLRILHINIWPKCYKLSPFHILNNIWSTIIFLILDQKFKSCLQILANFIKKMKTIIKMIMVKKMINKNNNLEKIIKTKIFLKPWLKTTKISYVFNYKKIKIYLMI